MFQENIAIKIYFDGGGQFRIIEDTQQFPKGDSAYSHSPFQLSSYPISLWIIRESLTKISVVKSFKKFLYDLSICRGS